MNLEEQKIGRNDPCPCGSGKKYKKCCEEKLRHKKFEAQIIHTGESKATEANKASKISTGFFQRIVPPKPPEPHHPPEDHPQTPKPI
jgi:hypothetical protein